MLDDRPWKHGPLKACLFDFGGTLDADGVTWQDRLFPLYWKHGLRVDREVFRQAFYRADDTLIEERALWDASLRETVEVQVAKVMEGLPISSGERLGKAVAADFLADVEATVARNRPSLEKLRSVFRLGIVSNFYGNLERVCSDLGILDLFDCLVDSSREGVMKPDARIFRSALERLGLEPEQAVFIGDNVFRDMQGARAAGMPHVWLAGASSSVGQPCCPGDPVIWSLEELPPLLLDGRPEPRGGRTP
ncbi:MAG: HAD family hydrolase [bacterium]